MDPAHQEAVARAKAIAARLAGMPAVVDYGGGSGAPVPAPAPSASYGANSSGAGAGDVNSQANAALEAAFGGGGSSAPVSYAPATSSSNGSQTADLSRKRGVEDALASLIPGLGTTSSDANKRHRSDASSADPNRVTKKLWIPSDRNPGYNYVGLLIGPGGSKQRELVAQSGGDVKISIRGRGSNSKDGAGTAGAPGGGVPGAPEEPLHVLLEGSAECVAKAEGLVRTLLEDSEAADKEKARQLGSLTGSGGGGVGGEGNEEGKTTAGLASGGYTPKPVAQILGLGGAGAAGGMAGSTPLSAYGPGGGGAAGAVGGEQVEEKIGVPNGVVGFIIGRGGESITSMQRKTGCRVQIQKEHEMAPGTAQRVITLTATTAEAIAQCRAIIETMVKERLQQTGALGTATTAAAAQPTVGPGSNAASQMLQLQKALAEGQAHVTVQVPDADVGLIIGKGGMQIRNIQEKSGANVQIPQAADANNPLVRTVNITHPNIEGANFAKQMIEEIMSTKASMNNGGGGMGGGGDVTIQVNCPDKDVGMIIGRGGCVIKQMQSSTRCRIQIPPTAPPGSPYRIISVIGPAAGCEQVRQMIERIIAEQSSQSVMAGVAYSGGSQYGQQQAAYGQQNYYGQQAVYGQQQAYGQQAAYGQTQKTDYSAEWAAYYAAQAAAQQGATGTATASAATATTSATAAAPAAVAGQQLAHDAYYEVFWQYAAYYGEEAARKHYGAWSPPVGTPNPNATASGTAAPSTASATAENPAPAPNSADSTASYQQSEIKDSSVRKVSNLPAWMNK